jgi:sulfite reductase alpha subunit-like flavoprotein
VDDFLASQDLSGEADWPFRISSAIPDQPLPLHLPPTGQTTTLRRLLTYHLDMRGSPRKSFFEWLRRLSGDEREQERLDEFIADPVRLLFPHCRSGWTRVAVEDATGRVELDQQQSVVRARKER